MKLHRMRIFCVAGAFSLTLLQAAVAPAASSFSNSLTGFTGNSTLPATQAAVGAAGFNFFSTDGLDLENFDKDPTVRFDSTGARFGGPEFAGDGGRNYMRTVDSDYATVSFVAEITYTESDTVGGPGVGEQVFFGMGAGDAALFRVPDWGSDFSSTFVTPENGASDGNLTTFKSADDVNTWVNNPPQPELALGGTHRLQMSYDKDAKTMTYSIDFDYTGGAFAADHTAPVVDLSSITCGLTSCGGGRQADPFSAHHFDASDFTDWRDAKDLTINWLWPNWDNTGLSQNLIDEADRDFWAANFGQLVSPAWPVDPSRIFFGGDDGVVFKDFSVIVAAGAGSAAGAVPEPATLMLLVLGALATLGVRRRG